MSNTVKTSIFISLYISINLLSLASATDHYLINCGSRSAETLDTDHRIFTGDDDSIFLTSSRTIQLEDTESQLISSSPLYQTARAFNRPTHYVFPIQDRGTHHLVRFHFHPLYDLVNEAQFHVMANGFLLLHNFRTPKTNNSPLIKEFVIPIDHEKLQITFMPSVKSNFGFINAIEVISAPKDLIEDVAQFVNSEKNEQVTGLLNNGFETVHRVNIGGYKVTPFNDSLWRLWVTDDEYLEQIKASDSVQTVHFGGRINYRMGGASREVGPDNVYNTARVIKSSNNLVPNVNITWKFEVEKGYSYMLRMHFCDIASAATDLLYFNVYVNGNLVYENLDISEITNRLLASPYYADIMVNEESSGILEVSIGPSINSLPRTTDAILNGIEIWKINNSMGSFDGEFCARYIMKSWRKEHVGILLPLLAAVLLLVTVFLLIRRRNTGSMGWSRLPLDVSEANKLWESIIFH